MPLICVYKRASTILCSQFDIPGWRDKLVDPISADAICDRILHDSYTVIIAGQESMRKRKGLNLGLPVPERLKEVLEQIHKRAEKDETHTTDQGDGE